MRASIIAIGSELVEGITPDTNSEYLRDRLEKIGYSIVRMSKVDDILESIKSEVEISLKDSDLVITTGGLGPTEDDLTREAVSKALRLPLRFDGELHGKIVEKLKEKLERVPMSIEKEAMVIEGARVLENDVGSAPGQLLDLDGKRILLLPGPPPEMRNVFEKAIEHLERGKGIFKKVLKFFGVRESILEDSLKGILYSNDKVKVALQADYVKGITIRLIAPERLKDDVLKIVEKIKKTKFLEDLYGEDDETMEEIVFRLLESSNLTLSVAESCTGGMLSSTIVNVPGVSKIFKGGIIAYENSVKVHVLKVERRTLEEHGAVSYECVREMAEGVKDLLGSDVSIAVSGIAGPGGGSEEKPVGTVFIDTFGPWGHDVRKFNFGYGDRNTIRGRSVMTALDMLRRKLLDWRDAYDEG